MVANRITRYSWGADHVAGSRYVTFERPGYGSDGRTHTDPSIGSWTRLMRVLTVSRVRPRLRLFLRQHALIEYIDRKAEEAEKKRR